jgi:CubicO group peptidase (beta-lactamase class C family)
MSLCTYISLNSGPKRMNSLEEESAVGLKTSRNRVSMGLTVLMTLLFGCGQSEQAHPEEPFAKARHRIRQLMERQNISSFQVAVAKDGRTIYEEAFGWANVEQKIPTTTQTMHLVASIDKPFTSTALMILAERGKIDLHGPVNAYLGEAKLIASRGSATEATVARMMLHTSGLPYGYYICGDEVPPQGRRTNKQLLDLSGVLVTTPGTRYEYSNIGYGLLGDVVREATGLHVKQFIQDEILVPLGLKRTGFFKSKPPPDAIATQNFEGGVLPAAFDAEGYTALYSTAGDLARFGMFHLKAHLPDQKPILTDRSLDLLWQYHEPGVECTTRRLGWDVQQDFGFETVQHGGGGPGIHNWLYMIPSENLVIALMSNARYSNTYSDAVLVELIAAALSGSGQDKLKPGAGRGYPRRTEINPADFQGRWTGRIEGPKGRCFIVVDFDFRGQPKLQFEGDERGKLHWIAPNRRVSKGHQTCLWRFDAQIPYLSPFAPHDEVILMLWPEGTRLVGSASAAKEKDFGRGENYVLPQFVELSK